MGFTMACLDITKGKKPVFSDIFKGFRYFGKSLGFTLLQMLLIYIAVLVMIVPSTILVLMAHFLQDSLQIAAIVLVVLAVVSAIVVACFAIPFMISLSFGQYVLADNPESENAISALKKSRLLLKGKKSDLVVLYLSFILWLLAGYLTCGILLIVYVAPYLNMTIANAYNALKEEHTPGQAFVPPDQIQINQE